ncbi:hypothetical protein Tsubulata_020814 [Turnera subulata]|uniref:Reverse transcriptase zinc-binding domain-containing protein n=1 Tax=Turnera subulata TaxID=218843 RepID=A0A9Q0JI26_9ROSI|nr:hypothetical protein Tsubulata_020814 [Turnera subulata]
MQLGEETRQSEDSLKSCCRMSVGDGSSCKFWHDLWLESGCLKTLFPRLFGVAFDKDVSVQNSFVLEGDRWLCNPNGRHNLYSWAVDECDKIEKLLESVKLYPSKPDSWRWTVQKDGSFSLKSWFDLVVYSKSGSSWLTVFFAALWSIWL